MGISKNWRPLDFYDDRDDNNSEGIEVEISYRRSATMARFGSKHLEELLLQAKYAPEKQRRIQLDACETLIRLIEPGKKYPFEFVCFHLTGYRERRRHEDVLIDYGTLQADLGVYSEQLSKTLLLDASGCGQAVYTVESLSRRLNVCGKTIARWRRKGLIGRYYCFSDRRKRLGFLASSVDYFRRGNRQTVREGSGFSQLLPVERERILGRLAKWAVRCPDRRHEAIARTARRFGRAEETVRLLLKGHERRLGEYIGGVAGVGFSKRADGLGETERREIAELYDGGKSIRQIMARVGRSQSNVYRAITLERARRLAEVKIEYVPCEQFEGDVKEADILDAEEGLFEEWRPEGYSQDGKKLGDRRIAAGSLGAYVAEISGQAVLTAGQEAFLFRKYNFLKHIARRMQRQIDLDYPSARVLKKVRGCLDEAEKVRDLLVRSNLRLVVSVARKHTRDEGEMLELVSEGNMVVMSAVEKFDFSRGYKFSTYASWAIVKRFATRRASAARMQEKAGHDDVLDSISRDGRVPESNVMAVEAARRRIDKAMGDALEERERMVVRQYYGLGERGAVVKSSRGLSFRQIGELVGLSKERIRQIEKAAMEKLRGVLGVEQFDLLAEG